MSVQDLPNSADQPRKALGHHARPSLVPLLPRNESRDPPTGPLRNLCSKWIATDAVWAAKVKDVIRANEGFLYVAVSAFCLCWVSVVVSYFYSEMDEGSSMPACQIIFARMSITGLCTVAYAKWSGLPDALLGPPEVRKLLGLSHVHPHPVFMCGISCPRHHRLLWRARSCNAGLEASSCMPARLRLLLSGVPSHQRRDVPDLSRPASDSKLTISTLSPLITLQGLAAAFLLGESYRPLEALAGLVSL
jgi:hypothetical protein